MTDATRLSDADRVEINYMVCSLVDEWERGAPTDYPAGALYDWINERIDSAVRDAVAAERERIPWSAPASLQTDSYATGQQLVHARIFNGNVRIDITDGGLQWSAEFPVPWLARGNG